MTEQEQHIEAIVQHSIQKALEAVPKPPQHGYITTFQGVITLISSIVVLLITLGAGVQKFDAQGERISKVEYQNQISIDDRHDIHTRLDRTDLIISEINQRLARIDTKLDEIKARQTK